jgi:hypothetical protein
MSNQQTTAAGKSASAHQGKDLDTIIRELIAELEGKMHFFMEQENVESNLSGTDRKRLFSAGVRNYGFIDKSFDIARDNPDFMPPHFDINALNSNLRQLEDLRQLMLTLQQFLQLVTNAFMLKADFCYRDALRIYASLKEQTKNKVPGAEPLFEALKTFFKRRRMESDEPTEIELEHDIKRLVHGKADGEIIIQNEAPHITGGFHKVVDSVHTGRSAFKESAEGEVKN